MTNQAIIATLLVLAAYASRNAKEEGAVKAPTAEQKPKKAKRRS